MQMLQCGIDDLASCSALRNGQFGRARAKQAPHTERNGKMSNIVTGVRNGLRQHAEYNRVASELRSMSKRELADIGISSNDIDRVAWAATHGA